MTAYYSFVIDEENIGVRADIFLTQNIDGVSRSFVKRAFDGHGVLINGLIAQKSGVILKKNDRIKVSFETDGELSLEAENIPLDIVFEDACFAVINKAQGMTVHPAKGSPNHTLVNACLYHFNALSSINGDIRPGIVHRLDKNTSGLIVIAKTDFAHRSLAAQIAEKSAFRIYQAVNDGIIAKESGEIDAPISRNAKDGKKFCVTKDGRSALTHYRVLNGIADKYTHTEFRLYTGRTHQIRVHSAYINHPITGDELYGGSNKFNLTGQLLHAVELELTHPVTGERLNFKSPLPPRFGAVLKNII